MRSPLWLKGRQRWLKPRTSTHLTLAEGLIGSMFMNCSVLPPDSDVIRMYITELTTISWDTKLYNSVAPKMMEFPIEKLSLQLSKVVEKGYLKSAMPIMDCIECCVSKWVAVVLFREIFLHHFNVSKTCITEGTNSNRKMYTLIMWWIQRGYRLALSEQTYYISFNTEIVEVASV